MKKKPNGTNGKKIEIKWLLKEGLYWLLVILVYSFTTYSSLQVYQLYKDYESQATSNQELKAQLEVIKSSRSLNKEDIELFNKISVNLIPEQENYFDLIEALENLASKSGFELYNYNINLPTTTEEKLSISVSGRGDNDSFFRFLQDYKYASGRLITIESISFTPKSVHEYTFLLNFYHKKISLPKNTLVDGSSAASAELVKSILASSAKLNESDVNFIREVIVESGGIGE